MGHSRLVGMVGVKTTTAQTPTAPAPPTSPFQGLLDQLASLLSQLVNAVASVVGALIGAISELLTVISNANVPVQECNVLKTGNRYYLKGSDGQYAIVDAIRQQGFMNSQTGGAIFTVVQKSCNVYSFSVNGMFMSRCEDCPSETGDFESVRFHLDTSTDPWSQWTVYSTNGGTVGGQLYLKAEENYGYLIPKQTSDGENELTLTTTLTDTSKFQFEEVPPECGILMAGGQYYLKSGGLFAVLDTSTGIGYMKQVPTSEASVFTVTRYSCDNIYGFCVDNKCMSTCDGCETADKKPMLVTFNVPNSDDTKSQWRVSKTGEDPPRVYILEAFNAQDGSLYSDFYANYQLTLQFNLNANSKFDLIPV